MAHYCSKKKGEGTKMGERAQLQVQSHRCKGYDTANLLQFQNE